MTWLHAGYQSQKPWESSFHCVRRVVLPGPVAPALSLGDIVRHGCQVETEFRGATFAKGLSVLRRDLRQDVAFFDIQRSGRLSGWDTPVKVEVRPFSRPAVLTPALPQLAERCLETFAQALPETLNFLPLRRAGVAGLFCAKSRKSKTCANR